MGNRLGDHARQWRFWWCTRSRPLRIVIGASGRYQAGWIPSDMAYLDLLNEEDWCRYFREASIDAMLAEHVWEHLTPEQGTAAARRCFRYLRPGGYLRVAVPDGFHPNPAYIEHIRPGGSGPGADDHKVLYNHVTFSKLFEQVGFRVTPLEYFDEQGLFQRADWSEEAGRINRSSRFDPRNSGGVLNYTSIIIDAWRGPNDPF